MVRFTADWNNMPTHHIYTQSCVKRPSQHCVFLQSRSACHIPVIPSYIRWPSGHGTRSCIAYVYAGSSHYVYAKRHPKSFAIVELSDILLSHLELGVASNWKRSSYQYMHYNHNEKAVAQPSYFCNENHFTWKKSSCKYWRMECPGQCDSLNIRIKRTTF